MPKRVNPRFGEDGYEAEPTSFELTSDQAVGLAGLLGRADDDLGVASLVHEIQGVGVSHRRWKGRGREAFSRSEARKAITLALALPALDCMTFYVLNEHAQQLVHEELMEMAPRPCPADITIVEALIRNEISPTDLRRAMSNVVEALGVRKGPDINHGLRNCIARLCDIYERYAGMPVTLSNKKAHREYTREPHSDAAKFVHACYALIDPEERDHSLNEYIRHWIQTRPHG